VFVGKIVTTEVCHFRGYEVHHRWVHLYVRGQTRWGLKISGQARTQESADSCQVAANCSSLDLPSRRRKIVMLYLKAG
jgi:hypothetical protein